MKKNLLFSFILLLARIGNVKAGTKASSVPLLREVAKSVDLSEGDKVHGVNILGISLELFVVLVLAIGIIIAISIVVFATKKPKPTSLEEAFEEALQELELTGIKGIGSKRAEELRAAGVNTISDLATSSVEDLAQKTSVSKRMISRWIRQAKEITEKNSLT